MTLSELRQLKPGDIIKTSVKNTTVGTTVEVYAVVISLIHEFPDGGLKFRTKSFMSFPVDHYYAYADTTHYVMPGSDQYNYILVLPE